MKYLLAFSMVFILSSKSFSQEWVLIGISKSNDSVFMRSNIVSRADDQGRQDVIKIWIKLTHESVELGKKTYKNVSMKTLWYVDCTSKQYRTANMALYTNSGDVLHTTDDTFNLYQDPVPDTMGEKILSKVCSSFNN
jgi:hypothetical protein